MAYFLANGMGRAAPRPRCLGILLRFSAATSGAPSLKESGLGFISGLFYLQPFNLDYERIAIYFFGRFAARAAPTHTKKLRLGSKWIDAKNMTVLRRGPQSPRRRINFFRRI